MKDLSPEYRTHVQSGATRLCTCWRITRQDGATLGFTDHDRELSFDGSTFEPAFGLDGAEQVAKLGGQVDTGEVLGILSSDAISEEDISLGRYDGATVETFSVNWADPNVRLVLRTDTIGEIVREDGIFRAELRSPQEQLNVTKGRRYSPLCDAVVGDTRCTVSLDDPAYKTTATIAEILGRHTLKLILADDFASGWFSFGMATWASGKRIGLKDRINDHAKRAGNHQVVFSEPVGDWVEIGNELGLTAGCDRTFAACDDKFANRLNFRGFPYIPGNDAMLRYPKAGDSFAGRPLVK